MRLDRLAEAAGVVGVLLILIAYAGAQLGRMEPRRAPALLLNLAGAGLILWSLSYRFNLAAFLMEAAWALVALFGLGRILLSGAPGDGKKRPPSGRPRA
jgi:hypothetical protein